MRSNVENDIYRLIAQHLRINYQGVVFHFDTSGVNNTSHYSRALYKALNGDPGWPDLHVAARSHPDFGDYLGLFIEVKKPGTRIRKKDGSLVADPHIRDQAEMIKRLNAARLLRGVRDQLRELQEAHRPVPYGDVHRRNHVLNRGQNLAPNRTQVLSAI
ncbi:hypothetical protein QM806_04635 [Rhodococcus sp. IEGM 1351]|uniref:hypothetical protein n=1 Tax=Rhodococcus sp. IEGM 1351 TaxID=3047089 RepID=UPI0024B81F88|nr:hypothetical protein [Rhodococcus sp. IEGM 1351]MDI9934742.1 hypothetical protein [Rhodococcus sp. IEGM 1351]